MSFLTNMFPFLAASSDPAPQASSGLTDLESETYWNLVGGNGGTKVAVNERTIMSLGSVLRALEVLTATFAMTPMVYYRRDGEDRDRATDRALYELFHDRPNDSQHIFLYKEVMLGDMLMAGATANYVHRDAAFGPKALSRVNPRACVPAEFWNREDGLELFYDATLPDGTNGRFTRAEIWHVPGFSRNGLMGVNRLKLLDDMFGAAVSAGIYSRSFFENNAPPSTVLQYKGKVKDEDKAKIKFDWKRLMGGPRNAGEVAVADQGMEVNTLGATNRDSQFIETRQFNVVEVARAFGVPPHLVFELSKATFSNIEHQSLEFIQYSMLPHYERIGSAATHYFAEPGFFFEFNPDALLKGDIKTRWEAYKAARESGTLNANEIRRMENKKPIPGPAGEEYWRPANMAISGQPNPSNQPPEPQGTDE